MKIENEFTGAGEKNFKWLSIKLVALITLVFIFQILYLPLTDLFAEIPALIFSRPWTLITHIFLHGGIEHLFYNMFALALFGTILEKIIGWRRFLSLFLVGGLFAGIGSALVFFYQGNLFGGSIGASGAIMAIIGALAVLRPRMTVYVYVMPLPMIAAAAFWAIFDILGAFNPFSSVNNFAHLFGMAFGLAYGLILRKYFGEPLFLKRKKDDVKIGKAELDKWEKEWMSAFLPLSKSKLV